MKITITDLISLKLERESHHIYIYIYTHTHIQNTHTRNDLGFLSHIFLPFLGAQLGRRGDHYTAYITWQCKQSSHLNKESKYKTCNISETCFTLHFELLIQHYFRSSLIEEKHLNISVIHINQNGTSFDTKAVKIAFQSN